MNLNNTTTDPTPCETVASCMRHVVVVAVLVVVAFAVLMPVLGQSAFIDVEGSILRLPQASHAGNLPRIFGQEFMAFTEGQYRPFSYALVACVRGVVRPDNIVFWQCWLVAFHVLNAVLVYFVAAQFTRRIEVSLLAAGVMLLHPAGTTFVTQINLFHVVLGGTLYLAAFLCYVRRVKTGKWWLLYACLGLFACGLLTSRAALTIPVLIVLYELTSGRSGFFVTLRRLAPFVLIAAAAIYLLTTLHPHAVFYSYPPKAHVAGVWYWAYSFAAGGVDTVIGLLRGSSTANAVSGLVGGIREPWNQLTVYAGCFIVGAMTAGVLPSRRRVWLFLPVFLLFFAEVAGFGSSFTLSRDYLSWGPRYFPLVGLAFLMSAIVDVTVPAKSRSLVMGTRVLVAVLPAFLGTFMFIELSHTMSPVEYWTLARKRNPRNEVASVELGRALLAKGRKDEAMKHLYGSVTSSATIRESSLAMGRYYCDRGDLLASIVCLRNAGLAERYGLLLQENMLIWTDIMIKAQAYDFAEHCLGLSLMANPENTRALRRLASVFAVKGRLYAAEMCLKGIIELDPSDLEAIAQLVELRQRIHNPEQKDRTVKANAPDSDWLRFATDQGQSDRIRNQVIDLAGKHPDNPVIQLHAAIGLVEIGYHERALDILEGVTRQLPCYSYGWATQCLAGALGEEMTVVDEALDRTPRLERRDAKTWHDLGLLLIGKNMREIALKCYATSLRADPDLPEVHNNMGVLLSALGRYRKALIHFRKALSASEENLAPVHNGIGYALMNLNKLDEAIRHFRLSIGYDPDQARTYHNVAEAHGRAGDFDKSIEAVKEGLARFPEHVGLCLDFADLLASAPYEGLRDADEAVRFAELARKRSIIVTPEVYDNLAKAYAEKAHVENGSFSKAVEFARKAAELADRSGQDSKRDYIRERLRLYESRKPYRIRIQRRPVYD